MGAEVKAVLVDSIVADTAPAGAVKFFNGEGHEPLGFHFQCPCGCRKVGAVHVAGQKAWGWNGSRTEITVSPSVLLYGDDMQPHWHGWLTDGVWRSC